jgi:hypothetical protein
MGGEKSGDLGVNPGQTPTPQAGEDLRFRLAEVTIVGGEFASFD